jgi:hypothetical protein
MRRYLAVCSALPSQASHIATMTFGRTLTSRRDHKSVITAVVFGLFLTEGWGQVNSRRRGEPSYLEALALPPEARVAWSEEVGHLGSRESHAVFTTLVVEDATQQGRRMRGVRIDLSSPDWKSRFYVDEGLLHPLKTIFDELTLSIERHPLPAGYWGFIGSCEFRDNPNTYPLSADFCYSGPDCPGLRVFGPRRERVMFPGRTPSHLSEILGNAIDELKKH